MCKQRFQSLLPSCRVWPTVSCRSLCCCVDHIPHSFSVALYHTIPVRVAQMRTALRDLGIKLAMLLCTLSRFRIQLTQYQLSSDPICLCELHVLLAFNLEHRADILTVVTGLKITIAVPVSQPGFCTSSQCSSRPSCTICFC